MIWYDMIWIILYRINSKSVHFIVYTKIYLLLILYKIIYNITYHIMKSKITDRKCKDCDIIISYTPRKIRYLDKWFKNIPVIIIFT